MGQDAGDDLSRMAVELLYLREAAKAAGEPFLACLIDMAAVEAERMGAEAQPEQNRPEPELAYAAGEAGKPER